MFPSATRTLPIVTGPPAARTRHTSSGRKLTGIRFSQACHKQPPLPHRVGPALSQLVSPFPAALTDQYSIISTCYITMPAIFRVISLPGHPPTMPALLLLQGHHFPGFRPFVASGDASRPPSVHGLAAGGHLSPFVDARASGLSFSRSSD